MGLPWIQVDKSFPESQEAMELAAELGVPLPHAIGLATTFWAWAADGAPDGVVRGAETARAVSMIDLAARHIGFGQAMLSVGLLSACDGGVRICGWVSRYGQALEKAAKDAERKRAARKRRADGAGTSADCPRDVTRTGAGKMEIETKSQTKRRKDPAVAARPPPDPRHAPLVQALTATAQKYDRGWKFQGGKDAKQVTRLLELGEPSEVERRWTRAWCWEKPFPTVRSLAELHAHWGHFGDAPAGRANGAPDPRKGYQRAEDYADKHGPPGEHPL